MATIAVTRRFDLTDAQWAVLEPLLPVPVRVGRPSAWTKQQLIDGVRWRYGLVRRGVMCRLVTAPGRRCMGCFAGGSERVSGRAW